MVSPSVSTAFASADLSFDTANGAKLKGRLPAEDGAAGGSAVVAKMPGDRFALDVPGLDLHVRSAITHVPREHATLESVRVQVGDHSLEFGETGAKLDGKVVPTPRTADIPEDGAKTQGFSLGQGVRASITSFAEGGSQLNVRSDDGNGAKLNLTASRLEDGGIGLRVHADNIALAGPIVEGAHAKPPSLLDAAKSLFASLTG